jgi:hypothetical protein
MNELVMENLKMKNQLEQREKRVAELGAQINQYR